MVKSKKKSQAKKKSAGTSKLLPKGWEKRTLAELEGWTDERATESAKPVKNQKNKKKTDEKKEKDEEPTPEETAPKEKRSRLRGAKNKKKIEEEKPEENKEQGLSHNTVAEEAEMEKATREMTKESGPTFGNALRSINNIGMGKQANMFIQSTATMLNAGLPLLQTMRVYQKEIKSRPMRKVITRMISDIESGAPLWRAMQNQHLFTLYDVAMVRIGEDAGNLARNMEYLSEQREKDRQLKQKVKMAMIYPTIVMVMMFVIVVGMGMFVLPNLVTVLFSLNVELPLATRAVIAVSNMFRFHGKTYVPLFIVGFIFVVLLAKFTRFRAVAEWFVFHVPGVGRLATEATIARFGVILGGLLQAGVPFVDAMESLVNVTQVLSYKKFYARLLVQVRLGDSLGKGFEEIKASKKLLPPSVQQLVVTGEQSGSLSESLIKISTIYEKKASETAQVLPIILEPILLLIIGGLVAIIAIAIIVPIYSLVGGISGG